MLKIFERGLVCVLQSWEEIKQEEEHKKKLKEHFKELASQSLKNLRSKNNKDGRKIITDFISEYTNNTNPKSIAEDFIITYTKISNLSTSSKNEDSSQKNKNSNFLNKEVQKVGLINLFITLFIFIISNYSSEQTKKEILEEIHKINPNIYEVLDNEDVDSIYYKSITNEPIRNLPSTKISTIRFKLKKGDTVQVLHKKGRWCNVIHLKKDDNSLIEGWVNSDHFIQLP